MNLCTGKESKHETRFVTSQSFKVQVKGILTANAFYIGKSFLMDRFQPDLFLVVVLVPPLSADSPLRFFVLRQCAIFSTGARQ
jgi:hypothetical protein